MRVFQMILIALFIILLACEEENTTSPIEQGYMFENIESGKLNAYPILGYMQTGSELAPNIDGNEADAIWQYAPLYSMNTQAGKDAFAPTITMKALYDNWYIYFLINWADTSNNLQKISDENSSTIDLDVNEDGFAFIWNHSSTDFSTCTNLCHTNNSMSTDYGEFADVWKWGVNTTDTTGYVDDKYLSHEGFLDDLAISKDDIETSGIFTNGRWTVEMKRRLIATLIPDSTDIEFNPDIDANVNFHIAVFDNSQGKDHAISTKVNTLHFMQLVE